MKKQCRHGNDAKSRHKDESKHSAKVDRSDSNKRAARNKNIYLIMKSKERSDAIHIADANVGNTCKTKNAARKTGYKNKWGS